MQGNTVSICVFLSLLICEVNRMITFCEMMDRKFSHTYSLQQIENNNDF